MGLTQRTRNENDILAGRDGTTFTYDFMNRPVESKVQDGSAVLSQALFAYNVSPIWARTKKLRAPGAYIVSYAHVDQLGRVWRSELCEDGSDACTASIKTDTTFDALGQVWKVTNPYRSTGDTTYGITETLYDALGRVTKVIPPDGTASANNITTTYSGNSTTVTDQAGKQRRSFADALGRLIQVDEPAEGYSPGTPPTAGTGSVTISGILKKVRDWSCAPQICWEYDSGGVRITVNGFQATAFYGFGSTSATVASALANVFNTNPSSPVMATVNSSTVYLTAKTTGASTNYSLSTTSWTDDPGTFGTPSFNATPSGSTLTGGSDGTPGQPNGIFSLDTPAVTTYTYDTLDNLLTVLQSGSRQRTFTYNSLSQLLTTANPEISNSQGQVCTVSYAYDNDGNLLTKTSPLTNQGTSCTSTVTATHSYDALHRLNKKTYSDGTPLVRYAYDGVAYETCNTALSTVDTKGRRTAMCDGAGNESWAYDAMGRVATDRRTTNSVTKDFTYTYNEDGSSKTLVYPTTPARTITYSYDNAGRATSASDGTTTYASAALYEPHGALRNLTNGASIVSTYYYNNRLQPCRISVKSSGTAPTNCADATNIGNILDFTYGFNAGVANNGNVASIGNNRDTNRSQSFTYDALNRIATAQSAATSGQHDWGLSFGYDIWANLLSATVTKGDDVPMLSQSVGTNNRISGYCYDAAGNLLAQSAPPCPSPTYTYDAENRMTATAGVTYTYDGDGRRVKKSNGKLYWYGAGSDPLEETDLNGTPSADYIFLNGKRTARVDLPSADAHFYFANHLGSANVVTSSTGVIEDESDYYPFGGERVVVNSDPNQYKFTGKERDTESGLDFFGARYYSSSLGRFMIPDWAAKPTSVPYADFGNPQSLNLYTYVENNPITRFDSDGHCCEREWQYFKQELAGAWDTTGGAVAETIRQFANGQAATNVRETYFGGNVGEKLQQAGSELGSQTVNLAKEVGSGNPRAIGQVAGLLVTAKVASELKISKPAEPAPGNATGFVVTPAGEAITIPKGATGPLPTRAPGAQYTGGTGGGPGLDPKVTGVRIMDANANQGARVVYMNRSGQAVSPSTGQTVPKSDPSAHLPLQPKP